MVVIVCAGKSVRRRLNALLAALALVTGNGLGSVAAPVDAPTNPADNRPPNAAQARTQGTTAIDTDHEFDAGSRLEIGALSKEQIENLVLLGKVWGFLKYHHPHVTAAQWHWDYELFRTIPALLAAPDRARANEALVHWLDRIGDPAPCQPCAQLPDSLYMRADTDWTRDRRWLGDDLSERLQRVYANRDVKSEQYYVKLPGGYGRPDFGTEAPYDEPALPDAGYRLLALFRFWNIVEYWYPYRDLLDGDWDSVLAEFIPRLAAATSRDEYRRAMLALLARLRDTHASVWNALDARPPRGDCFLPVALRAVEGRFVVAAYSDSVRGPASGLEIGDVIGGLDGRSVDSIVESCIPYYGASNDAALRRDIARSLTRGGCGPCRVQVERAGKKVEITASRDSFALDLRARMVHDLPGVTFRMLGDDVVYLKLSTVLAKDATSYVERAAGTRCFVIDIRNRPKEPVIVALGQHLVTRVTPFARFTRSDGANPGAFYWREKWSEIEPQPPHYDGKVVLLIDEATQSHSEFTAMGLRTAPGALVVGSTTAGADGDITNIPLPGGLVATITGLGVFYPDKSPTQRVGIVPDLVVRPTIAGIRAGHDEVLEATLEKVLGRKMRIPMR